jgi:hypothetical protein
MFEKGGFRPRSDIELDEHDEMVEYQSVKQNEYELAVFNTDTKKLKLYKAEKKEFIEV